MYLYYEKTPGRNPIDDIYEFILSSYGATGDVDFGRKTDKALTMMLSSMFKQVATKNTLYDPITHIWTFIGHYGQIILAFIESGKTQGIISGLEVIEVDNLQERVKTGTLNKKNKSKQIEGERKFKEEDFFYAPVTQDSGLSGPALVQKLVPLLLCSEDELTKADNQQLKKFYRLAAMRLHPDRNNGDASKMSELNMLWGIYTSKGV